MKGRRSKKKKNLSNEKRDESLEQKRPKSSNKLLSKSPKSPSKNVSMIYKNKNLKTDKDEKYDKLINEKKYLENQLKAAHKEKKEYEKFINTISKSDKLNKEEKE